MGFDTPARQNGADAFRATCCMNSGCTRALTPLSVNPATCTAQATLRPARASFPKGLSSFARSPCPDHGPTLVPVLECIADGHGAQVIMMHPYLGCGAPGLQAVVALRLIVQLKMAYASLVAPGRQSVHVPAAGQYRNWKNGVGTMQRQLGSTVGSGQVGGVGR